MEGNSSDHVKIFTILLAAVILLSSTVTLIDLNNESFSQNSENGITELEADNNDNYPDRSRTETDRERSRDKTPVEEPSHQSAKRPDERTNGREPGDSDPDAIDAQGSDRPSRPERERDIETSAPSEDELIERERPNDAGPEYNHDGNQEPPPSSGERYVDEIDTDIKWPDFSGYKPKPGVLSTEIDGPVSTQTWDVAGSPYYVTGHITVPVGNTLIIDPGVDVVFNGSWSIFVEGALYANGTSTDRINFTSNQTSPTPGDWGSVQFNTTGGVGALGKLLHCNFTFATKAVIINSGAGIEVGHSHINYTSSWGIDATEGGFYIHHTIFNTTSYALFASIVKSGLGSVTIDDITLKNNWVTGAVGFSINSIRVNNPADGSNIVVGSTTITDNFINVTSNVGAYVQNYQITNMNGGTVTWGDINISNNLMNMRGTAVLFTGELMFIDDVDADLGELVISGNNITTSVGIGIKNDWWDLLDLSGTTTIDIGRTSIENNIINSPDDGIYFYWDYVGHTTSDNASITIGDISIYNNTITSGVDGVDFTGRYVGYDTNDNSMITVGDLVFSENTINANNRGIFIYIYECANYLYNNSRVSFGEFRINNNDRFSTTQEGFGFFLINFGYYMYSNSLLEIGNIYMNNNDVDITSAPGLWAINSYAEHVGEQMFGNSQVLLNNWYLNENIVTSTAKGIYFGSWMTTGSEMNDNTRVRYGDTFVLMNKVSAALYYGIFTDRNFCGYYMYDDSWFSGGNFSMQNNNVSADDAIGYYFELNSNLYYMYNNSHGRLGWVDISLNNFSSNLQDALQPRVERNGAHMYGTSQGVIGQLSITHNIITASILRGIYFSGSVSYMGWQMYGFSTFTFGDWLINNNTVRSELNGFFLDVKYFGHQMYDNASVDIGMLELKNNDINSSNGYAMYAQWWYRFGVELYQNASVTAGDFIIMDNDLKTVNSGNPVLETYIAEASYDLYDNSKVILGDMIISNNEIYSQGDLGLYGAFVKFGQFMEPNLLSNCSSYAEVGDIKILDNNITVPGVDGNGILFDVNDIGVDLYDNASVKSGNFEIKRNTIYSAYAAITTTCNWWGYRLYGNNSVINGVIDVSDNVITMLTDDDGIGMDYNYHGNLMYYNSYYEMGSLIISNNEIYTPGIGIASYINHLGEDMVNNSKAVFNDFIFNYNNITALINEGIYITSFQNIGRNLYGTSSIILGDLDVSHNTINASGSDGINLNTVETIGWNQNDYSSVTLGDFLVINNNIIAGYRGIYSTSFEEFAYKMNDHSIFTMGNWLINDNIIRSTQSGIYIEPEYWGNYMHDNSSAVVGAFEIRSNYINASSGYGSSTLYYYDFAYEMYENSSFTAGDVLIMNNDIIDSNTGIFNGPYSAGRNIFDNARAIFGDHIIKNNDVVSNFFHGISVDYYNVANDLKPDSFNFSNAYVEIGDLLIIDNNVTANDLNDGIQIHSGDNGINLYDSADVSFGNLSINGNNVIAGTSSTSGIELMLNTWGNDLYDNSTATFGYFEINNNNVTADGSGAGIGILSMNSFGYNMFNNSYFEMGDLEVSGNVITSENSGISGGFSDFGASMYGSSQTVIGDFTFNGNEIISRSNRGLNLGSLENFGYEMYDDSGFTMGDILINNNNVHSFLDALYFEPSNFAATMYDNSKATIGNNEIMNNYLNTTEGYGIYAWWMYDFGYETYHDVDVIVGSCYIMNNDVIAYGTTNAIWTGPWESGSGGTFDNSTVTFGDYVVSENDIFANNSVGLNFEFNQVGFGLGIDTFPNSVSKVTIGNMIIKNNNITSPRNIGLHFEIDQTGDGNTDWSELSIGRFEVNGNTINSYLESIFIDFDKVSPALYNNASISFGTFTIDDNKLTSTNDKGLSIIIFDSFDHFYDSNFMMGMITISNNIVTSKDIGIEYLIDSSIDVNDKSTTVLPALWITGNTVDSTVSAFNYTAINTTVNVDQTSTLTWDYVVILDNDFDGGIFGSAITYNSTDLNAVQPGFIIIEDTIHDGPANSTGLFLHNIDFTYVSNVTINNFDYGIYVNDSQINIMGNSTVSNIALSSFYFTENSSVATLNTTFNQAITYYKDFESQLFVLWYMHVQVKDPLDAIVPNANLTVTNIDSFPMFDGKADSSGRVHFIRCLDYLENKTGIIKSWNDHNVTADDAGMYGYTEPTMDSTKWVIITLIDNIKPRLVKDNSDTLATTGDPFTFRADITDNLGVDSVFVEYWFGSGTHIIISMGDVPYNFTGVIQWDSLDELHYVFDATDIMGNTLRTGQVNVTVYDNDKPYSLFDNSDTSAVYGNIFQFNAQPQDNIDVTEVHVEWWFDSGTMTNDTMTMSGAFGEFFVWNVTVPQTTVQVLHYYFTVSDAAGNWRVGPVTDTNVSDNVPPDVEIIKPTDGVMVRGTIEIGANASDTNSGLAFVAVRIGAVEIYNGTPAAISFNVNFDTTTVPDGQYTVKAVAFDNHGLSDFDSITITIDNTPPDVDAGPDVDIEVGGKVDFDGSGSTDNYGIVNYTWTFTYNETAQTMYGAAPEFQFDIDGSYVVTLTVTDLVGNSASDEMTVTVTKPFVPPPARPKVVETTPADGSKDIPLDTAITITFSLPMNTSSVESVLELVTPGINYTFTWNENHTVLTITFDSDLDYETEYSIKIGDAEAKTGGLLEDAPFSFSFTTIKAPKTPTITITPPSTTTDIGPGDTITISGTSTDIDEGTEVTVTVNGETTLTTVGSDGSWSVQVTVPDTEGDFEITVAAGDTITSETVTVKKPVEQEKEPEEEDNTLFIAGILILVIILVLVAVLFMMRKKKDEPAEELDENEGKEEELEE